MLKVRTRKLKVKIYFGQYRFNNSLLAITFFFNNLKSQKMSFYELSMQSLKSKVDHVLFLYNK